MRHALCLLGTLAALAVTSPPVMAQEIVSDILIFERGQWTVTKTTMDDGMQYCVAAVRGETAWVNIWLEADGTTTLQFDSDDWGYDISTETFIATIDNRKSLPLGAPEFDGSSVNFLLPYTDGNVSFFADLRAGQDLFLNNTAGELIANFPLSGSSASIVAAVDCMDRM